ncbi:MAG: glycosyltransferase family 2 protein [Patescibacteria group bacterium]
MKLSVTLAAYNEEKNIGRCLEAVRQLADEIIIVDGESTDKTVSIAKKYGAKIFSVPNDPINFHKQKKLANNKASGDWILQLDADEVVTPELLIEIKKKIASNPVENGFWIPRANFFLGRFLKKGGAYPDYTLRLYRRGRGDLAAESVHEQAVVEGKVGYLKNDLLHFNNPTFSRYIVRLNQYTDSQALKISGGIFENLFRNPLFDKNQGFFSIYFRHLGFLDGFPGFIWALFSALHFPIAYFKKIEKQFVNN